jgi:hypothetical protein
LVATAILAGPVGTDADRQEGAITMRRFISELSFRPTTARSI